MYMEDDLFYTVYRMWELKVKQVFSRVFPSQSLMVFLKRKTEENVVLLVLYGQHYGYSSYLLKDL